MLDANAHAAGLAGPRAGTTSSGAPGCRTSSRSVARIYWETHLSPLLHVDGRFDEVALELATPPAGCPVVVSAVVHRGGRTAPVPLVVAIHARGSGRGTSGS